MVTRYPGNIDGYGQVRVVRNRQDEVLARDHNDLRSAVIAIETTLGINVQGPYGTVASRLVDSYNSIVAHASGLPPKHTDAHIDSSLKTGVPYSLSAGTLREQITTILSYINSSMSYTGSGSVTFADGYAFPASTISSAITNIIRQLGSAGGTSKIEGDAKSGSPNSLSAGTLKSQLEALLTYINNFSSAGASTIGATPFDSSPDGDYKFLGTNVQDQIEESGRFLDDNATLWNRAFDSFVMEGLEVSYTGGMTSQVRLTITAGYANLQGKIMKYDGVVDTVFLTGSPSGTYYVYAYRNTHDDTFHIGVSNNLIGMFTSYYNPKVILSRLVCGTSCDVYDMRRFGLFSNDKHGFTVGNKYSSYSTHDGYGCDFISLRAAVDYINAFRGSYGRMMPPGKITLSGDLDINDSSEAEIELPVNIEIDGAGHKIYCHPDASVFSIEEDNITIKNLTVQHDGSFTNASFAKIAYNNNVDNLKIIGCTLTGANNAYFVVVGNSSGSTQLTNSIFSNNFTRTYKAAISFVKSLGTIAEVFNSSIIENNIFIRTVASTSTEPCIRVGSNCKVSNNYISGGFESGIVVDQGTMTSVCDNTIIGYISSSIYMNSGIVLYHNTSAICSDIVISNNLIHGINSYGINCYGSSGNVVNAVVSNNIINNYVGTPVGTSVGIYSTSSSETLVIGNQIFYPGSAGIKNCSNVSSNHIKGYSSNDSYGNFIESCKFDGINLISCSGSVVNNNLIFNNFSSGHYYIKTTGDYISIENNTLYGSSGSCLSKGIYTNSSYYVSIKNNTICIRDVGIYSKDGIGILVSGNNYIGLGSASRSAIVIETSEKSLVNNNNIYKVSVAGVSIVESSYCEIENNYIYDTGYGIKFTFASSYNTNTLIKGNYIIGGTDYSPLNAIDGVADFSIVEGNYILNFGSSGSCCAILLEGAGFGKTSVINNSIIKCIGIGISCDGLVSGLISGNVLEGVATSTHAIYDIGAKALVNNNIINNYGQAVGYGFHIRSEVDNTNIVGNIFSTIGSNMSGVIYVAGSGTSQELSILHNIVDSAQQTIIEMNNSIYSFVSGNFVSGISAVGSYGAINNVGQASIVCNNHIIRQNNYGIKINSQCMCYGNIIGANDSNNNICIYVNAGSGGMHVINNNGIGCYNVGIYLSSGADSSMISGNTILSFDAYDGIGSSPANTKLLISNNKLESVMTTGVYGITGFGSYSLISGNYIKGFGASSSDAIKSSTSASDGVCILNNLICYPNASMLYGVDIGITSSSVVVSGNIMGGPGSSSYKMRRSGINMNSSTYSVCSNNYFYGYGSNGTLTAFINFGSDSVCSNNIILNPNGDGIGFNVISRLVVCNNYIKSNTYAGRSGIIEGMSSHCNVFGNTINGGDYGVESGFSANMNYNNNYFYNQDSYGLYLGSGNVNCVSNYIFSPGSSGIYMAGLGTSHIGHNFIDSAGEYGIRIYNTNMCHIVGNTSCNSTKDGIRVMLSDNCLINGNYVYNSGSGAGIYCDESDKINISKNYINGANYGIYLSNMSYGMINGNSIEDINFNGIFLSGSYVLVSENFIHDTDGNSIYSDSGDQLSFVGNMIINIVSGIDGIYLGSCTGRNILLSSNHISVHDGTAKAVNYSGTYDMKVTGNIALDGTNPYGTHWNAGYNNTSTDNIFISSP
jgi:parallel beta-helix repeat protein